MNRQQGSDVAPGTGRDTLTAEGRGVVRVFWKKLWNVWRGEQRGVEDGWMKGWLDVGRCRLEWRLLFILQVATIPSTFSV